jgi:hypothetical protein
VSEVSTSGEFVSQTFDSGSSDTRYNFIEWDNSDVPSGTIKFQIRTASSAGGLSSAAWVGSDGTSATYYTVSRTAIVLDPGRSGSRYFQYKMILESDGVTSPLVESVRINFTP